MSDHSSSSFTIDLTNHFLIAMPNIEDPLFARSVIFVCEHSKRGALGIIINKPSDLSLSSLFHKVDLSLRRPDLEQAVAFHGGPVQTERGFVLHDAIRNIEGQKPDESLYAASMFIKGGLEMTTSRDVLEAMSAGVGPKRVLIALGYSAWESGELESELLENNWLTVVADANVIFETPVEDRYEQAIGLLGLESWMLSPEVGHG